MATIEEQVELSKIAKIEDAQAKKIEREAKEAKRKADEKFLREGKCWFDLFNGKEKELEDLRTYMGKWCMERVCMGEGVGITKDFMAGIRLFLEMMESYPIEYKAIATRLGGLK
jgi:hypothetical protein